MPTRRSEYGDVEWGDLIVAVDGQPIEAVEDLLARLEKHSVGDKVKLTVVRNLGDRQEQSLETTVSLAAEKAE